MKIFMSGGENPEHAKKMYGGGAKNILMSYYYIKSKKIQTPLAMELAENDTKFMIDSGAFTIRWDDALTKKDPKATWEFYSKYCLDYLDWVMNHRDKVEMIAELDIESRVGMEIVTKLQEKYFMPFEKETKIPVCYVWHEERKFKGWAEMCKKHTLVGLPGNFTNPSQYLSMVRMAARNKVKVHGFAMTRAEMLLKVPFYSVDSTRWLTGEQYGCLFIWNRKEMLELRKDDKQYRKRFRNYFAKAGLDLEKIMADENMEVGKANVRAWVECEKYVNRRTVGKQWWSDPDQVKSIKELEMGAGMESSEKSQSNHEQVANSINSPKTAQKTNFGAEGENLGDESKIEDRTETIEGMNETEEGMIDGELINQDPVRVAIGNGDSQRGSGDVSKSKNNSFSVEEFEDRRKNNQGNLVYDETQIKLRDAKKKDVIETSLVCNTCYAAETCKSFKENSVCTIIDTFKRFPSTDPFDCLKKMQETVNTLELRAWQNFYFERLDGGVADKNVTGLFNDLIGHHELMGRLYKDILPSRGRVKYLDRRDNRSKGQLCKWESFRPRPRTHLSMKPLYVVNVHRR